MRAQERETLLQELQARFEKNMHRHKSVAWADVQATLISRPVALKSFLEMGLSGGEPDVIGDDRDTSHVTFCDCSANHSVVDMAGAMGIDLLTEEPYRELQRFGERVSAQGTGDAIHE